MKRKKIKLLKGKEPEQTDGVLTAAAFFLDVCAAAVSLLSAFYLLLTKPGDYCI